MRVILYVNGSNKNSWSFKDGSGYVDSGVYVGLGVRRKIVLDGVRAATKLTTAGFTTYELPEWDTSYAHTRTNTKTLKLFGGYELGTNNTARARMYGFKIYEDDVLVKNYLPHAVDGVVGLKETVGNEFLVPSATYQMPGFTMGGGYVPGVGDSHDAFVESDGTQTVNLGYFAKGNSRIEFDYAYTSTVGDKTLCGAWTPASGVTLSLRYTPWNNGLTYKCIFGHNRGEQRTNFGGVVDLNRHTVVMDFKNKKVVFRTGDTQSEQTYSTYTDWTDATTCEIPMGVFGTFRDPAATVIDGMRAAARVYGIKIYENDELVHDYVPYKKDGEVGFYDVVTKAFRVNARGGANPLKLNGGGTFRAQPQGGTLHSGKTLTLSALAAGAQAYQWYRDGEAIAGATDDTLTVAWEKGAPPAVYTVKAVFDLYGTAVETVSPPAEVTFAPRAFVLIVR